MSGPLLCQSIVLTNIGAKKRFILWQDLFLFKPYRRAAIVQGKLNILLDKNGFYIKWLKIKIKNY